jgi:hypothetical protein
MYWYIINVLITEGFSSERSQQMNEYFVLAMEVMRHAFIPFQNK